MSILGTSTSVLTDKTDFDALLRFEPEVVEFYNYPSHELSRIERFCNQHGIRIALHTPVPYDRAAPLRRFAPTGPDPGEAQSALEMALETVRCAERLNAQHVVVHFPSPYVDFPEVIEDRVIERFLDPVMNESRRLGVRVLVENISSHPTFHDPEHYEKLLNRYDGLGFCLDFGHAHQLGGRASTSDFITRVGSRIWSCHVYNQRSQGGRKHVPVDPEQQPSEGWIDLRAVVAQLLRRSKVATWILEPDPLSADEIPRAEAGARWFRHLLQSM